MQDVAKPEGRPRPAGRAVERYREMQAFQNSQDRPDIHLVDGGVADNLGVRAVLEALEELIAERGVPRARWGSASSAGSC